MKDGQLKVTQRQMTNPWTFVMGINIRKTQIARVQRSEFQIGPKDSLENSQLTQ